MLALVLALLTPQPARPDTGLLLEGGTVYVSSEARPRKASVLILDGKVAFVGDPGPARTRSGSARRVDVSGSTVFPGWADAHGHLLGLGKSLEIASLRDATSASDAATRIRDLAATLPADAWVEGRGWDQNRWPGKSFPDARDLDALVSNRPVAARRVDGHALWVNTLALERAGIRSDTPDPAGGRILRRGDGSPSGVLVDNAADLVQKVIPAAAAADLERRFLAATRACAKVGLTEVQDASAYGAQEIAALERLAARGDLPIRIYATVSPQPEALAAFFAKGLRVGSGDDFLTVRAIKAYADGALGSRGAALLADYSDEPGKSGLLVMPPERLDDVARQARAHGWQLWIHAIGDRGNRVALDAFRKAVAPGTADNRPRVEHAQVIALGDIPRFGAEHVIASVQPTHATSDMSWAEARVGPERIRGAYAWRSLKSAGARLAGGSDFPVESENPLLGFYAAITRQDLAGNPPGGWRASEKLTRREALALFTSDAAWAAFEENRRGRIAPGYAGDLTVFARDPMTVSEKEVPAISVAMTVVGGRVSYAPGRAAGLP
ncbi:MAG TPA: amidohydrolase [Thermoanaerobaculia bacterium]